MLNRLRARWHRAPRLQWHTHPDTTTHALIAHGLPDHLAATVWQIDTEWHWTVTHQPQPHPVTVNGTIITANYGQPHHAYTGIDRSRRRAIRRAERLADIIRRHL